MIRSIILQFLATGTVACVAVLDIYEGSRVHPHFFGLGTQYRKVGMCPLVAPRLVLDFNNAAALSKTTLPSFKQLMSMYLINRKHSSRVQSCLYTPLDPQRNQIRILELHPGGEQEPVHCSLSIEALSKTVDHFDALSWTWGSPKEPKKLIVVDNTAHAIPPSLYDALMALRETRGSRYLWIDCICISQQDTQEKSTQIPLMTEIYGSARRVLIWLGLHADHSELVTRSILDNETHNYESISFCNAVMSLCNRNWFQRVWTLQEFVIPKQEPLLLCGREAPIPWSRFSEARRVTEKALMRTMKIEMDEYLTEFFGKENSKTGLSPRNTKKDLSNLFLFVFGHIGDGRFFSGRAPDQLARLREAYHGQDDRGGKSLSAAVIEAGKSKVTQPRDRIYGLLGLVETAIRDGFLQRFGVSYDSAVKTDQDVYRDAVSWMLTTESPNALRIFDLFNIGKRSGSQCPSWVPDFGGGMACKQEVVSGAREEWLRVSP